MSEPDSDLAEILAQFTNLIMNERVKSYNEGLDAANDRNVKLVAALEQIVTGAERFNDGKRDSDYGQGILKGLNSAADIARTALQQSTEKP